MTSKPSARALGRQLRSGLITASIVSLADNVEGPLIVELVKAKLWPTARALAFARRIPNPYQCSQALIALSPHLDKRLCYEAVAASREIRDWLHRAITLIALAPDLDEPEREH